jgi:hypothetical protein
MSGMHVRTTDLSIVQHKELRHAVAQGLNHIPLQPTHIAKAIAAIMHAYEQLTQILDLEHLQFPVNAARKHLHDTSLSQGCHADVFGRTDGRTDDWTMAAGASVTWTHCSVLF